MTRLRLRFWWTLTFGLFDAHEQGVRAVWAQPRAPVRPTLFAAMMGGDPQRTGRSALRGPHSEPQIRWRFRTHRRVFGSPVVDAAGRAIFGSLDGTVHAVDANGVERWAWTGAERVFSSPVVVGEQVVFGHDGDAFVGLDVRGRTRFSYGVTEDADSAPLVTADGTVIVASRTVSALDREGNARYATALSGHVFGAPALGSDGTLWLPQLNGTLTCVRSATGEVVRQIAVGATLYGAVLAMDDGAAAVAGGDGRVRVFNADGSRRWEVALQGAAHGLGCRGGVSLAHDGTLVVGSDDGGIYGLAASDGHTVWRTATAGPVRSSARIDADGWMYLGSEDDRVYALGPDGALQWSVTVGADVDSTPALLPDGTLVVGADDGALYALR